MDQQVFSNIKPKPKSKRPLSALLLALSSIVFCDIPFIPFILSLETYPLAVYWGKTRLWIFEESVLCLGTLASLVGVIMGTISLVLKDENNVLAIAAISIGIIDIVAAIFAMFFSLHSHSG